MKTIAIIPARAGSKRIPGKNIRPFCGKPIIAYSIETAQVAGIFDEIMVSTDDEQIAKLAGEYGAKVPFLRSAKNSDDKAHIREVLEEVITEYKKTGITFDIICCLYPTAPLLKSETLKNGFELITKTGADSVIPVVKFSYPPQRGLIISNGNAVMMHPENYNKHSGELESVYHDAGQFVFVRTQSMIEQKKLFCTHTVPVIMSEMEGQDIDTEEDWMIAEMKFEKFK